MTVEQIEALKLMVDCSENFIKNDEVIATFENESIRLMDAAAASELRYQALKASVDASESLALSIDEDSKVDTEPHILKNKIDDLEREAADSAIVLRRLELKVERLKRMSGEAKQRESDLQIRVELMSEPSAPYERESSAPGITERRDQESVANSPFQLRTEAVNAVEELDAELQTLTRHTRDLNLLSTAKGNSTRALRYHIDEAEEAKRETAQIGVDFAALHDIFLVYEEALKRITMLDDVREVPMPELVDIAKSYRGEGEMILQAELNDIMSSVNKIVTLYSKINPNDSQPSIEGVYDWLLKSNSLLPTIDLPAKRFSMMQEIMVKPQKDQMKDFLTMNELRTKALKVPDQTLMKSAAMIMETVEDFAKAGITAEVQLIHTAVLTAAHMATLKVAMLKEVPSGVKMLNRNEFFSLIFKLSEFLRRDPQNRILLADSLQQAALHQNINNGVTLYAAALKEAASALPENDKKTSNLNRLKVIEGQDNDILVHYVKHTLCLMGQPGKALKSAIFGGNGIDKLSIEMLHCMQGFLALATAYRYVAETHAKDIADALLDLITVLQSFKDMFHSCLRDYIVGVKKVVDDFQEKFCDLNSTNLISIFILRHIFSSNDTGIEAALKEMRRQYDLDENVVDWNFLMEKSSKVDGTNLDHLILRILRHESQYQAHKFGKHPLTLQQLHAKLKVDTSNSRVQKSNLAIADAPESTVMFAGIKPGNMPYCKMCGGNHAGLVCITHQNAQRLDEALAGSKVQINQLLAGWKAMLKLTSDLEIRKKIESVVDIHAGLISQITQSQQRTKGRFDQGGIRGGVRGSSINRGTSQKAIRGGTISSHNSNTNASMATNTTTQSATISRMVLTELYPKLCRIWATNKSCPEDCPWEHNPKFENCV